MTPRETFGSRIGVLATMVGLAVGLGNVWRFPYMVGQFGGGAFILLYLGIAFLVAIPALMGEWSIGRHTRLGTLGAFEEIGLPGGRYFGWLLGGIAWVAVAYYTNAIGWVAYTPWHKPRPASAWVSTPRPSSRRRPAFHRSR